MSLLAKPLNDIRLEHVQALVDVQAHELMDLEWKAELPGQKTEDRKEFAKDVSAMANAVGGDFVYGIRDDKNADARLSVQALSSGAWDTERTRMEQLILTGIRPRISGIQFKELPVADGKHLVIMRVPRSLNGPHMVTIENHNRFYLRRVGGKLEMDVDEIRNAFLQTESFSDRVKTWSDRRLDQINASKTGLSLGKNPTLVIHFAPLAHSQNAILFDQNEILKIQRLGLPGTFSVAGASDRHNLAGYFLCKQADGNSNRMAYIQVFRTGAFEAVCTLIDSPDCLYPVKVEGTILESFRNYLGYLKQKTVLPPIMARVSLLNCNGLKIAGQSVANGSSVPKVFEHDQISLPEIVIDSWDAENRCEFLARPLIDLFWNAGGYLCSPNFDDSGHWYEDGKLVGFRTV